MIFLLGTSLNALGDPGNIDLGSFRGDEVEIGTIAAFKRPPQNINFGRVGKDGFERETHFADQVLFLQKVGDNGNRIGIDAVGSETM